MLYESKAMAQLSDRWFEGQKKIQQGEQLVRDGQLKIQDGKRLITEGGLIQKEAEDNHKNIKRQAVPTLTPESVGSSSGPVITPLGR